MSNINGEAEKFYYSLKLDKLNENELYYLSNSLNIPKSDNKKDIIEKILNKLEYVQKDEFDKITKIIDNLLNKQEIKKNDDNNIDTNNFNNDKNKIYNINYSKENQAAPNPQIPFFPQVSKPNEQQSPSNLFDLNTIHKHDPQSYSHTQSKTAIGNENIYNNNILENKEQKISVYDKIFFLYSPEVKLNSKIRAYLCYCCCCCSLSIETIIKINFAFSIFDFVFFLSPLQKEKQINIFFWSLFNLIFDFFLFISNKKNNSRYARYNLFYNEIKFLYKILTFKESFNSVDEKFADFLLVCKKKDQDSLAACIGSLISYIILKIDCVAVFLNILYNIYIAYYQIALIKLKTSKKLQ